MTPIAAVTAAPVSMHWNMSQTARAEMRSRAADAPARSDEPHHPDSARRSPLYRALIGALRQLVAPPPATTTPVAPDASAAPVDAVSAPTPSVEAGAGADIEQALMNFTRALMQTLRGEEDGPGRHGRGHAHGHHREHHDHGRRAWGDPARRIEQLGVQIGAALTPTPTPVADTAAAPAAESASATATDATVPAPTNADAQTTAPSAGSTVINLTIHVAPPAATSRPADGGLLGTFRELHRALGHSTSGSADNEASIGTQLANFLRALSDRLAQDAPAVTDLATQPGALIDLRA